MSYRLLTKNDVGPCLIPGSVLTWWWDGARMALCPWKGAFPYPPMGKLPHNVIGRMLDVKVTYRETGEEIEA